MPLKWPPVTQRLNGGPCCCSLIGSPGLYHNCHSGEGHHTLPRPLSEAWHGGEARRCAKARAASSASPPPVPDATSGEACNVVSSSAPSPCQGSSAAAATNFLLVCLLLLFCARERYPFMTGRFWHSSYTLHTYGWLRSWDGFASTDIPTLAGCACDTKWSRTLEWEGK